MHAAKLHSSDRLKRTLAALTAAGAEGLTTDGVRRVTGSVCVHSNVAELRANGIIVECRFVGVQDGSRVYRYTLGSLPPVVAPVPRVEEDEPGPVLPATDCLRRMREALA